MADFISGNEVWLIVYAILIVMAIIGYIADKDRKKDKKASKKKEEKEKTVEVVEEKKAKEVVEEKKAEPEAVVDKKASVVDAQEETVSAVEEPKEKIEEPATKEEIPSQPVDVLPETLEVSSIQEEVVPSLSVEKELSTPMTVEEITSQPTVESTPETDLHESVEEIKDTTFSIPTIEESLNSTNSFYDTSMFTQMPSSSESVSSYEKELSTPTTDDIDLSSLVPKEEEVAVPSTITETGEDLTVPLGGTTIDSSFSSMPASNKEYQDMDESLGMSDLSAFQIGDKIDQSITSDNSERNF